MVALKQRHEHSKAKKNSSEEIDVSLCAYFFQSNNSSSNVEWIMDYGASNHTTALDSLFNSYDTKNLTHHKVSISDGNHLLVLRFGKLMFLMILWSMCFMFKEFPYT